MKASKRKLDQYQDALTVLNMALLNIEDMQVLLIESIENETHLNRDFDSLIGTRNALQAQLFDIMTRYKTF